MNDADGEIGSAGSAVAVGGEARARGGGVAEEALHLAEAHAVLHHLVRGDLVVDAHPRAHAEEGEDREAARRARGAAGGQRVVRARAVVAEDLGGALADEEAAVVLEPLAERDRVLHHHLDVLDRQPVRHVGGGVDVVDHHGVAVLERRLRRLRRRERLELREDLGVDGGGERLRRAHQIGLAGRVARLREQVGRHDLGARVGVGDHLALARPREHVDRDASRHERLRRRHVHVAGAAHRVARADGAGAVRERGDRVGAADGDELVGLGDVRRRQDDRQRLRRRDAHRLQPATRAVIAVISTVDGSGYRPPGA